MVWLGVWLCQVNHEVVKHRGWCFRRGRKVLRAVVAAWGGLGAVCKYGSGMILVLSLKCLSAGPEEHIVLQGGLWGWLLGLSGCREVWVQVPALCAASGNQMWGVGGEL